MMPLATRIVSERRAIVLPLLALALVNAGLYGFAVYPLSLRVRTLEARAGSAAERLAAAEKEFAAARALVAGRERADAELRTFYTEVLPQDLAGARRMTYARLAQITRDANLRYERRSYTPETSYEGDLQKLGIVMHLSGDYGDVRAFVHELETSPEFVVIERMTLAEKSEGDPQLRLTLDLATYYRAVPNGD
jgi:hypothetical protein